MSTIEILENRIAPAVIYAIEQGAVNQLVSFSPFGPGALLTDVTITGLHANELIVGLDLRPATGKLYAMGLVDDGATRTGYLYTLDPATGAATMVGSGPFSTTLADTDQYGFDFNPVADLIRIGNSSDQNIRLYPGNGTVAFTDPNFDDPDANESIYGLAYDRSFGSGKTTLYAYNYFTDELATIGGVNGNPSPNGGVVNTIGHVKLDNVNFTAAGGYVGFDIGQAFGEPEQGWLSLRKNGTTETKLYQVNLATAALTEVGQIGSGDRFFGSLTFSNESLAPTIVKAGAGSKATWMDVDGDLVTLTVSKGMLAPENFRMLEGYVGDALSSLTLTGNAFKGANITLTAKAGSWNVGDGFVNVGRISALNIDLGAVKIDGDLVVINAGELGGAASLKSLSVRSMGAFGYGPLPGSDDAFSFLSDGVGSIKVLGDVATAISLGIGTTGSVTIGGDLRAGPIAVSGGLSNGSNAVKIGKVLIKGSVLGTGGNSSGQISLNQASSLTIGGSVVGGDVLNNGGIFLDGAGNKQLTIGGSLVGGSIGGGTLFLIGTTTVVIKGDLKGGAIGGGGAIVSSVLKSLTIGGSIISGGEALVISANYIGSALIKGSVVGTATAPVLISSVGNSGATSQAAAVAIGKLTILGDLENSRIVAGAEGTAPSNVEASIGAIRIGRDMIASSIAAGIDPVDGIFGNADDKFIGGTTGNAAIVAKIASVTIGGQLVGTLGGAADQFGIEAEQIGALKIGKFKLSVSATQKDEFELGFTGDVRVKEF